MKFVFCAEAKRAYVLMARSVTDKLVSWRCCSWCWNFSCFRSELKRLVCRRSGIRLPGA